MEELELLAPLLEGLVYLFAELLVPVFGWMFGTLWHGVVLLGRGAAHVVRYVAKRVTSTIPRAVARYRTPSTNPPARTSPRLVE